MASRLEAERAERIASNKRRMEALGLQEARDGLEAAGGAADKKTAKRAAGGKRKERAADEEAAEPPRSVVALG